MSKLLEYLNTLDKDAAAREAHAKDPEGATSALGLTDEELEALLSRDRQAVADVLGIAESDLPALDTIESPY